MITVTYSLKGQSQEGKQEILATPLSYKPLPSHIPTGIFVDPVFFRRGVIYPSRRLRGQAVNADQAKEAKLSLDRFTRRLRNIISVIEDLVPSVTMEQIEYLLKEERKGNLSKKGLWITRESAANALGITDETASCSHHRKIQDYFLEYAMSTGMDEHAFEVNAVYARRMLRFELFQQRIIGIRSYGLFVDTVTLEDLSALQDYIRNEAEIWESHKEEMDSILEDTDKLLPRLLKSKPCKHNGQIDVDMMNRIKAVINWLRDVKGEIKVSPFDGLEIGRHVSDKIPIILNDEEISRIINLDLKKMPSFDLLRDIFVFQCKTGVRLRDAAMLDWTNIHEGNVLRYEPKMIREEIFNPEKEVILDETCMAIIKKHEGEDFNGHLFVCVSQLSHSSMLQAILKKAGINRLVLAHNPQRRIEQWIPLYRKACSTLAEATYYYTKHKNRPSVCLQDRPVPPKERNRIYNEINKL